MSLEFENAIAIQPVEGSGSGLQFQNTIYIQPKDEGGSGGGDVGDVYQSIYSNGAWGSYDKLEDNTLDNLSMLRFFGTTDTALANIWDYTGVLTVTLTFTYGNNITSSWYYNPFVIIRSKDGYYHSTTIHVENNEIKISAAGQPTKQLVSGHTYTIKFSLDSSNNTAYLYCKEEGVDNDFVLIGSYVTNSTSSADRQYIEITNTLSEGYNKPIHNFADFDLSDIIIDIDGTVIFSRK